MNANLKKQMKWILNNPKMVDNICEEYRYGNTIKGIVANHGNEFDRFKVYAALDYKNILRRNRPNNIDDKRSRLISKIREREQD